jgi:hypothetical protein
MSWRGVSVNLSTTDPDHLFALELPVPPLFESTQGPVMEIVFWSGNVDRWVHAVSAHFARQLPEGHVQVTVGDLAWIDQVVSRWGLEGLRGCVEDLELVMVPDDS